MSRCLSGTEIVRFHNSKPIIKERRLGFDTPRIRITVKLSTPHQLEPRPLRLQLREKSFNGVELGVDLHAPRDLIPCLIHSTTDSRLDQPVILTQFLEHSLLSRESRVSVKLDRRSPTTVITFSPLFNIERIPRFRLFRVRGDNCPGDHPARLRHNTPRRPGSRP